MAKLEDLPRLGDPAFQATRSRVRFFTSYAHDNKQPADDLLERLREQLAPSKRYEYVLWRDTQIEAGQQWRQEIRQALDDSDLALLLVSPAFLISPFITQEELPRFVGDKAKPVIPVLLQKVDFVYHDLKGLKDYQIFRLGEKKSFADCRDDFSRRQFAEELFLEIERRLEKLRGD
jgi:hypothetical protein